MALDRFTRVGVALVGAAFGLLTLAVVRQHPDGSFAGASTLGGVAELGAGWSLIAAGLVFWRRHRRSWLGPLLAAAGLAWFLPEWSNYRVGTSFGFTLGLVGFAACTPLVAHAALAYPTGRLRTRLERTMVGVSYAGALLLLGLLPTTVFAPRPSGCLDCPRNLALVTGDIGLDDTFNRYGLRIGIAWLAALGALFVWRAVRSARNGAIVTVSAVVAAGAYMGFSAWDFQHSLARGLLSNDSFDVRMWRYRAAALAGLAFAVAWGLFRERRARESVARFVVELGRLPSVGTVRDTLAHALGDPSLELAYRRSDRDDYVDAVGRPFPLPTSSDRAVTRLLRRDEPVAALVHDPRLLDRPDLVQEVIAAARVAVENERLQAELRAQLEELRASRARIVEASDAERRKLERDLHDGAQQRIVALSLALQLLQSQAPAGPDASVPLMIDTASEELRSALAELRTLAHGIYPVVLADEGLAAALETLAERADAPVTIESVPEASLPDSVESAAYFTVLEAVRGTEDASVRVEHRSGTLLVRVRAASATDNIEREARMVAIRDRVGALGGSVESNDTTLEAEIPCA